uniref:Uncharacterized protein n=1 Tax=Candidatus Kentrum sp. FW TaxID=2126338 RepID=A0A450TZB3_9GAMM|nr:MAG: hypothetical protein BECKFW1821C_GA0114237_107414 [Candidatus Kentron sp. FW]
MINKETFSDFDFADALEFLDLFPYRKWQPEIAPILPSDLLKGSLKRAERQVTIGANEWEHRLFKVWEFGKYTMGKFYKTDAYSLAQLDVLLGILHLIFGECEKYATSTP